MPTYKVIFDVRKWGTSIMVARDAEMTVIARTPAFAAESVEKLAEQIAPGFQYNPKQVRPAEEEETLQNRLLERLAGEFALEPDGCLRAYAAGAPAASAVIMVEPDAYCVTIQACDFETGELVWQVTFTDNTPIDLMLATAHSAAEGKR